MSKKRFGILIGLISLFSVIPHFFSVPGFARFGQAWAAQSEPEGTAMWVWDARVIVDSSSTRALFRFCKQENIRLLYLSAYRLEKQMGKAYRAFNRQAHALGIEVHALAGDPRWGQSRYHHIPLGWVQAVQDFNRGAAVIEQFDGVHSDVEVYLLAKSWKEKPAELLGGYLDMNAKMMDRLKSVSDPIFFGVDIPFWFDDDRNYRIAWRGQVKAPTEHVLDTVDGITVMAYRNFSAGENGTVKLVRLELRYADTVGKPVRIGQETQEEMYPPYISFGGTSCGRLKSEIEQVRQAVREHPSFGGFAIHHYESYRKLCR